MSRRAGKSRWDYLAAQLNAVIECLLQNCGDCCGSEALHPLRAFAHSLDQGASSAMTKIASLLTLFVTLLVCLLPAAPAQAQRARVFVASYGSDPILAPSGHPARHFSRPSMW
jgi:hypothetical protein